MISKIETEADYTNALSRIEELLNADTGTEEGNELDCLVTLVEKYEDVHHPIDPPSDQPPDFPLLDPSPSIVGAPIVFAYWAICCHGYIPACICGAIPPMPRICIPAPWFMPYCWA